MMGRQISDRSRASLVSPRNGKLLVKSANFGLVRGANSLLLQELCTDQRMLAMSQIHLDISIAGQ